MGVHVMIDLEMCRVRTKSFSFPCKNEIIQIGAVLMDESYIIQSKFSSYVRPRFGKIDGYISSLTGIYEKNIKDAPDIESALEQMLKWIGTDDATFYSWSATDYYQIKKEIQLKCHENENWEKLLDQSSWIDYQKTLGNRLESFKLLKLSEALDLVELDTKGHSHDGLDDAYNTEKLISKLETNKEYQTILERYRERETEQEPLMVSFASFLQGVVLETA